MKVSEAIKKYNLTERVGHDGKPLYYRQFFREERTADKRTQYCVVEDKNGGIWYLHIVRDYFGKNYYDKNGRPRDFHRATTTQLQNG